MEVFALFGGIYSDRGLYGIFSTREKAEAHRDKINTAREAYEQDDTLDYVVSVEQWDIQVCQIDEPCKEWILDFGFGLNNS